MDLVGAISDMKQAQVMGQVQMSVAKKMLDVDKMQGAAMIKLIDAAGSSTSKAGDALVAAATGLGGSIDVYG